MNEINVSNYKNVVSATYWCRQADEQMKKHNFVSALDFYTTGLLHAPALHKDAKSTTTGLNDEYPLAMLYSLRSLTLFRLKRYKECIDDIKRAFASGKHDQVRKVELMNRLAWSYWHLKNYRKCSQTANDASKECKRTSKELEVLKKLISKSKVNVLDEGGKETGDAKNGFHGNAKILLPESLHLGENKEVKGISSSATWNHDPQKGRYLTANVSICPGRTLVDEEAYSGVLNERFLVSNCNYCFKECKLDGVPCCGCSLALYCDERCRLLAWRSYHWIECCMWPVLKTLDVFAHLALRTLLCSAYNLHNETDTKASGAKSKDCFSLIAEYLHHSTNSSQTKSGGKKRSGKKTTKQMPKLDGKVHGVYSRDYWSIFCLQAHEANHSKVILTKCALYANYLGRVLNQLTSIQKRKAHRLSSHDFPSNPTAVTAHNIKSVFLKLSLQSFCGGNNEAAAVAGDMEAFREKTLEICKQAAAHAPIAKLKPQSCFLSKELPKSFQGIVSYLMRRHMMQLHTNCQAVYDMVADDPQGDVSRVTQQRIATAFFPSLSLLNHSCSANTVLSFVGRKLTVRASCSIAKGLEISHCYGPTMSRYSFRDRQRLLKEQYYFDCNCLTCSKYKAGDFEDQVFLQQFTAYRCEACNGPILILDGKPTNELSVQGKCANDSCKRVFDLTESYKNINTVVSMSNTFSQRMLKSPNPKDLQNLEKCLKEMKRLLYRHHHAIGSLHDQLAFHYSELKDYASAAKHVEESLRITIVRFGPSSIEVAQESYKLATLYFNSQNLTQANKYVKKTLEIYKTISAPDKEEFVKAESMHIALNSLSKAMGVAGK